jgi:hypothetical protein
MKLTVNKHAQEALMAKNSTPADRQAQQAEETQAASTPAATEGGAAEVKADERFKMVKHPETGEMVKRQDYIRELWQDKKWKRGDIAKHLSEITGKKVPYQIVFAATKKLPGGPDKTEETQASEATA